MYRVDGTAWNAARRDTSLHYELLDPSANQLSLNSPQTLRVDRVHFSCIYNLLFCAMYLRKNSSTGKKCYAGRYEFVSPEYTGSIAE